jgi:hypothetical protein
MAHMVKVQRFLNGFLETKNHFIETFFIETLEEAIAFIEKHPDAHCRIFDGNGEHKHERHPLGTVSIDVPVSLSTEII